MKTLLFIFILFISFNSIAQKEDLKSIVELAETYRLYHSLRTPKNEVLQKLEKYKNTKFQDVAIFITEAIKKKNSLIDKQYLKKPDSVTLKLFYTIIMVNYNMYNSNPDDNYKVAKRYLNERIDKYELIQTYYSSLFTSIINKNRPFDYSAINWDLNTLNLTNDIEKSIFFLVFIDKIGFQISSYYNAFKGPNWEGIERYVKLLPTINNKKYFQYQNFDFDDFKMIIYKENRLFKKYYLEKYYDVLLGHTFMLKENKEEAGQLLNKSILNKKEYYTYTNKVKVIRELKNN